MLYLMCDDLRAFVQFLSEKNVSCTDISEADWGMKIDRPSPERKGEIGLYQPTHQTAI